MEQERRERMPEADVNNPHSWLAIGIAVGSGVGVATDHIALGVGAGLALGTVGAILSRRQRSEDADKAHDD